MGAIAELETSTIANPTPEWLPPWLQTCWHEIQDGVECGDLTCLAFKLAYDLHKGQTRASGEPYILHPVQVSALLKDLGGDDAMIAAGFLHDVVEDTDITVTEIASQFGDEVAKLVEGVTKLSKLNFASKTEHQAENFRRLFISTVQDHRVIVVKLADRLHNMRTLQHLPPAKQVAIAKETRDIFAPLANRLGIGQFKWELEDLAFKYLEPEQYREMQNLVAETRSSRAARIDEAIQTLRDRLAQMQITDYEVSGRPKHLYGIYEKMQRQEKRYGEIYDLAAVRVIVNTNIECYTVLSIAHDSFRPVDGRFKDYIGNPKPNGYKSLHTVVITATGQPLEIQIRTWEMHQIAEYGIAAHWKYKEQTSSIKKDDGKFSWLRQIVETQKHIQDDQEYIESIKENLFDDEICVYTPKGDLHRLPRGSTAVDFAYRIHTEVGNHCAGALVNERMVTLDRKLQNGEIVQILTQNNAHPSLDWINFAATSAAKNRIRQWYKRLHREDNLNRGRALLEKELGKTGLELLLKSDQMTKVVELCNYHNTEDLLAALGYGEISVHTVTHKLRANHPHRAENISRGRALLEKELGATSLELLLKSDQIIKVAAEWFNHHSTEDLLAALGNGEIALNALTQRLTPLPQLKIPNQPLLRASKSPILGVEGMIHHLAGCCNPLPGEPIIGVVPLGGSRSIAIHRQDCPNFSHFDPDRLIPIVWNRAMESDRPATYPVRIQIEVIDRIGIMSVVLARLADHKINVSETNVKTNPGETAFINLTIDISDRQQFESMCRKLKKIADIISIRRIGETKD